MKKEIKVPKDTRLAMFILAILVVAFVAINLSDMDKLKIKPYVSEVQQPTAVNTTLDSTVISAFGLIFAFVVLLLAAYLYEKKSLMEPIRGKTFAHHVVKSRKVASHSEPFSFFGSSGKSSRNLSFDAYANSIHAKVRRPGFNAVETSKVLSDKFKHLPSDEQQKKLQTFLKAHRAIEDSLK